MKDTVTLKKWRRRFYGETCKLQIKSSFGKKHTPLLKILWEKEYWIGKKLIKNSHPNLNYVQWPLPLSFDASFDQLNP